MLASVVVILSQLSLSVVRILLVPAELGAESVYLRSNPMNNGSLDLEHDIVLSEFRVAISDVVERDFERSDQYLLRWLMENEMNVDSANLAFRKAQKWRKENDMDNILSEPSHTSTSVKDVCHVDGQTTDGGPIINFRMSETDFRKVILAGYVQPLQRQVARCYENALQDAIKTGHERNLGIVPAVLISNLQGFNMRQHFCINCPSVYREFIELEKYYYPRLFKKIILVNTPGIFMPLIEMMRPLFSQALQDAIVVFGNNKTEWFSYLSNIVPVHQLPSEFGGTKIRRIR